MKRHRSTLLALALAVGATATTVSPAAAQTSAQCTASFHVLHNDRIGSLQLPEGAYQLQTRNLTCGQASTLFGEFLQDYNGVLQKPWRYSAQGVGRGTFTRSGGQSFTAVRTGAVAPGTRPGPAADGGGSHGELVCPGAFDVLHNDRVGRLSIPKGDYRITMLGSGLTCSRADTLFARFLNKPNGKLGRNWQVLWKTGEFVNGASHRGFRIKSVDAVG